MLRTFTNTNDSRKIIVSEVIHSLIFWIANTTDRMVIYLWSLKIFVIINHRCCKSMYFFLILYIFINLTVYALPNSTSFSFYKIERQELNHKIKFQTTTMQRNLLLDWIKKKLRSECIHCTPVYTYIYVQNDFQQKFVCLLWV